MGISSLHLTQIEHWTNTAIILVTHLIIHIQIYAKSLQCVDGVRAAQALLIITHTGWGTVKSHLLQTRTASDILGICTISISCGLNEGYSQSQLQFTHLVDNICPTKRSKGLIDLRFSWDIPWAKQRTGSKTATTNHSVTVCVSFIVFISVWLMVPHNLPLAVCDMPICCNPHSSHSLHLHPAVRCHLSVVMSRVYSAKALSYCEPQSPWWFLASTPKPWVRVKVVSLFL